jgi:acylphosphatase
MDIGRSATIGSRQFSVPPPVIPMTMRLPCGSSQAPGQPAAVHLSIHGLVQGVGFRDALGLQAQERGLDGWVRNRRDGSVEALIRGEANAVEALIRWARHGPPAARVQRLDSRPANADEAATLRAGFHRLPTA